MGGVKAGRKSDTRALVPVCWDTPNQGQGEVFTRCKLRVWSPKTWGRWKKRPRWKIHKVQS